MLLVFFAVVFFVAGATVTVALLVFAGAFDEPGRHRVPVARERFEVAERLGVPVLRIARPDMAAANPTTVLPALADETQLLPTVPETGGAR